MDSSAFPNAHSFPGGPPQPMHFPPGPGVPPSSFHHQVSPVNTFPHNHPQAGGGGQPFSPATICGGYPGQPGLSSSTASQAAMAILRNPDHLLPSFAADPQGHPIRPHPFVTTTRLFINNVPPAIPEASLALAMRECTPFNITLSPDVRSNQRIKPDAYYDWMPRNGTITFTDMYNAEKALAILQYHPYIIEGGAYVSPFEAPNILPHANPPVASRYIRPLALVAAPHFGSAAPPANSTDAFMRSCPTPSELYDGVRPWGAVRAVSVWVQNLNHEVGSEPELEWNARVEFWHEDEARRFEVGIGETGSMIKGWQISIFAEALPAVMPMIQPPPILPQPAQRPHTPPQHFTAVPTQPQFPHLPTPQAMQQQLGIMYIPPPSTTNPFPGSPTPSASHGGMSPPPWAFHNPFTVKGDVPMSPRGSPMIGSVSMSRSLSRSSLGSLRGGPPGTPRRRQRTWSVATEEMPEGGLKATGLIGDDGTFIIHGPGQHIRPAPSFGPGSKSASGLVDYSNVFVKNLDEDINSMFLAELFQNIGRIVSARVMRDEAGRSRGYGFVSFQTPEEAAHAIKTLDGTKVGKSMIQVTLHEPRKLRPEKIKEKQATGHHVAYGRQSYAASRRSSSPLRTDRRGNLRTSDEPKAPGTTDDIRLLDPSARRLALVQRVSLRVKAYAQSNGIPEGYISPVVESLVAHDLELIPLLHDPARLNDKIAEVISVLEQHPEVDHSLGNSGSTATHMVPNMIEEDKILLRSEVERIDPMEVDQVMEILLAAITPVDMHRCLENKGYLAHRYSLAKRELIQRQENDRAAAATQDDPQRPDTSSDANSSSTLSPAPTSTSVALKEDDGPHQAFEPVPISDVSVEGLARLPVREVLQNLKGAHGDAVLGKLGFGRPTIQEVTAHESWMARMVMKKHGVERRAEVASGIGKRIPAGTLKRSQKMKIIMDLVNAEDDDEALCELMLYPALLEAKLKHHLENPNPQNVS